MITFCAIAPVNKTDLSVSCSKRVQEIAEYMLTIKVLESRNDINVIIHFTNDKYLGQTPKHLKIDIYTKF